MHKFTISQDAAKLRAKLLSTGDRLIVEASPFDRIWGIGYSAKDASANKDTWGENLLGVALMNVRRRLREQEAQQAGEQAGEA